jgi:adenylosuccinate lyase
MTLTALEAISPVDGRYRGSVAQLADFFSESALIKYRVRVEIEYFLALCALPLPQLQGFPAAQWEPLREVYRQFSLADAQRVKAIEKTTNHDVKAVEYFIKEKFDRMGLPAHKEFIHFGLTSQDINNTAVPLALKEAWQKIMAPALKAVTRT